MKEKDIRPDTAYEIEVGFDEPVLFSALVDRIDFYQPLGAYILKFFHNEQFLNASINEDFALRLAKEAYIPLIDRNFLYESEYKLYLNKKDLDLEDLWNL